MPVEVPQNLTAASRWPLLWLKTCSRRPRQATMRDKLMRRMQDAMNFRGSSVKKDDVGQPGATRPSPFRW